MSEPAKTQDFATAAVLFELPREDAVHVRRDVAFGAVETETLSMDVYSPAGVPNHARLPAVVIVAGYPDPGFRRFVGCRFKEMASVVCWARLFAASGLVAIAYENRDPERDLDTLLRYVNEHAGSLGVDETSMCVWATSGNGPLAVSLLMRDDCKAIRCAVLCYSYTLDLDGHTAVADAAKAFGFANPGAGRTVDDIRRDAAMFIARAGRDGTPGLNETLDRFVAGAIERNVSMTFVNHANAPHAFDLFDDSLETREIIRQQLSFIGARLAG